MRLDSQVDLVQMAVLASLVAKDGQVLQDHQASQAVMAILVFKAILVPLVRFMDVT